MKHSDWSLSCARFSFHCLGSKDVNDLVNIHDTSFSKIERIYDQDPNKAIRYIENVLNSGVSDYNDLFNHYDDYDHSEENAEMGLEDEE